MIQELISKYDSEFCGKLPIHLINVIQPYGALLVIQHDHTILQASENSEEVFNKPVTQLVNTNLDTYLTSGFDLATLEERTPTAVNFCGVSFLAVIYRYESYILLEINLESREQAIRDHYFDLFSELRQAMIAIETAEDIQSAAEIAARELKAASGFDKVMIYRFDKEWNGNVLAEEKEADMESYIDFTFPASDIPKQARDLYLKNPYRFIPDCNFTPVKLHPVINPVTSTFLDLSDCNVRGVSSVHIEYLRNMKVTASMSTRILKRDQLWGLIACHHKTPKEMNYKMCGMFELLSGMISTKISALEDARSHDFASAHNKIYTDLLGEIYRTGDIKHTIFRENDNILDLFNATGGVLTGAVNTHSKGVVPNQQDIDDLLLWLQTKGITSVFKTDSLSAEYDYALHYRNMGSGLLVIPVEPEAEEYILLFRPEVIQVINWGGDPQTRINFEHDMKTYHPRFSFKLWQENVNGISLPWKTEEIATAEKTFNFLRDFKKNDHAAGRKK